jgi:hypothetical protein
MMGPEISYRYWHLCWFQPAMPVIPAMADFTESLPVSPDGCAVYLPRNMFAGPIRFRALVDVEEAEVAAEFGPHERREASLLLHSEGESYCLQDLNGLAPVLDHLDEGDYRVVLLASGIDKANWDRVCKKSNERYWLLLQPVS